jgi:YVTN family beta-propeller protein
MHRLLLICFTAALGTAQVRIYVANAGGSNVSIIDPAANKVIREIAVSTNPHGLAASPEGHWIYSTSATRGVLDAIDLKTGKRTRGVATGREPFDLAVAPDTRHVFVCTASSIDEIDTASLERTKSLYDTKGPCRLYLTPDGTRMIVAPALRFINVRSMETEFSISAGAAGHALALEGDPYHVLHRIFAAQQDAVAVIDYATRKVTGRIPVVARDLAVSPDRKMLWATVGDSVEVFSLTDLKRVAVIPLGKNTGGIAFTPDAKRCFIANTGDNSVSSIDTATDKELARIPVGNGPDRLVASEWMP